MYFPRYKFTVISKWKVQILFSKTANGTVSGRNFGKIKVKIKYIYNQQRDENQ